MFKTIWMSDPHFSHEGDVLGHDPRLRLRLALEHINAIHADAGFCVISGDMVNRGTQADYLALSKQLNILSIPVLPMVGNHDNRALFRESLPVPENSMADFVQYSVSTSEGLIICLDTQMTGADAGELCEQRLDWLRDTLRSAGDTPVFVFMHHPPLALGLPMQDTDSLRNGNTFLDIVAAHKCVKYLFIGHVHRPISGSIRGVPFSTMRSILYQAPAPRPEWNWKTFHPSEEAPNIGVVTIAGADVTLQYEQFCKYDDGMQVSA